MQIGQRRVADERGIHASVRRFREAADDSILATARKRGTAHLVLDGIIIPTDRCAEKTLSLKGEQIDLWYSAKAHTHGANLQGLMDPSGFPLFLSDAEPGSTHDLTAARTHVLPALYPAAAQGLPTLADLPPLADHVPPADVVEALERPFRPEEPSSDSRS